jgi:hypothetical protein
MTAVLHKIDKLDVGTRGGWFEKPKNRLFGKIRLFGHVRVK